MQIQITFTHNRTLITFKSMKIGVHANLKKKMNETIQNGIDENNNSNKK